MKPMRNPVIGWNVRPARYSSGSIRRSSITCGVIQPAQTFSRGNVALSMTATSAPACRSVQAQVEPAGPPPTMSTSHLSTIMTASTAHARPRNGVAVASREDHLKELHASGGECGARAREIELPRAHERFVEHRRDMAGGAVEPVVPVLQGLRVVQPQVFDVEDR